MNILYPYMADEYCMNLNNFSGLCQSGKVEKFRVKSRLVVVEQTRSSVESES